MSLKRLQKEALDLTKNPVEGYCVNPVSTIVFPDLQKV